MSRLRVSLSTTQLLADGQDTAIVKADAATIQVSILEGVHRVSIDQVTGNEARIRAGILPGPIKLRVEAPGYLPAIVDLSATIQTTDRNEDGTPDFLRLDDARDRQPSAAGSPSSPRRNISRHPNPRPAEIDDCAALIRYAYREALRAHDSAWAATARLPLVPAFDSVGKYEYPYTPLGAALFRVRAGPFRAVRSRGWRLRPIRRRPNTLASQYPFRKPRSSARRARRSALFSPGLSDRHAFPQHDLPGRKQIATTAAATSCTTPGPKERTRRDPPPHPARAAAFPGAAMAAHLDNPSFLGVYRWNILKKAGHS